MIFMKTTITLLTAFMSVLSVTGSNNSSDAFLPPFKESFPKEYDLDSEESQWTVIDNNNDNNSWISYREKGFDGNPGYICCHTYVEADADDYLVTKKPILLEKGTAHIEFHYRGGDGILGETNTESFDVLYGNTNDIAQMQKIASYENFNIGKWTLSYVDFEIPENGKYYIAFQAKSKANNNRVSLDNITIDNGQYNKIPEMEAAAMLLPKLKYPYSQSEKIGIYLKNNGFGSTNEIKAAFNIKKDGKETGYTTENISTTINPQESKNIYFNNTVDFSEPGTYYVTVVAQSTNEKYQYNDTCHSILRNIEPATLPYSITFKDLNEDELFWYPINEGGWTYNSTTYKSFSPNELLASSFFNLKNKTYQLCIEYSSGNWGFPDPITEDFEILLGASDTDISEWKVIHTEKDAYTEFSTKNLVIDIDIPKEGYYAIGIRTTKSNAFDLYAVQVYEKQEHDVEILTLNPDNFARILPYDQVVNPNSQESLRIANNGQTDESAIVTVFQNEMKIYETPAFTIAANDTIDYTIPLQYQDLKIGDFVNLKIDIQIENEDTKPENNSITRTFSISKDEYAFDNITNFTQSVGDKQASCGYGKVFGINHTDTISGVKIAFDQQEQNVPFKLNIYTVDQQNIARLIMTKDLERNKDAGYQSFEFAPIRVETGKYFIEVAQKGTSYMGLCYEKDEKGSYDIKSSWMYNEEYFNPDSIFNTSGHWLGIRPIFQDNTAPTEIDLEAVEFITPADKNLMLNNEPVKVIYKSNGYKQLENIQFKCLVDNQPADEYIVEKIIPYQESFEVNFEVDLTQLGTRTITVYPVIENDENKENDTISKSVESIEEGDPYIMDFELCTDFATDRLNPRWQSIDKDGGITGGYSVALFPITWPGWNLPFGFVAFDPQKTTPIAPDFFEKGYQGEQFGASFFIQSGEANNDWLISPKLQLGENPSVNFLARSQSTAYGAETYNVLVSTTGTEESDFVKIGETREASEKWERIEIPLSEYKNQKVHIAIQCISQDKFIFLIDDIHVVKDNASVNINTTPTYQIYISDNILHVYSSDQEIQGFEIIGLSGQPLLKKDISQNNIHYALDNIVPGIYICNIIFNNGLRQTEKIIIE